jgi:uncharacterized protein (TIGR00255 family)
MNSMTAFSRTLAQIGKLEWVWELKSVNHRFLDQFYRLPEAFRSLEPSCRQIVSESLQRGRLEIFLQFKQSNQVAPQFNFDLMQNYKTLASEIEQSFNIKNNLKLSDFFNFPQMWSCQEFSLSDEDNHALLQSFRLVVEGLLQTRRNEGESIARILKTKLEKLESILVKIQSLAVNAPAKMQETIHSKLAAWYSGQYDEQRFEQELLFQLLRVDITEEVDRLMTHFQEFKRVISQEENCGRRLDFLVQECHRETNTIGSKTDNTQISQMVIDMKVIIEQLREQIQNVE